MLKGNLSSFSLGEIFQSLAINNHTGTLRITTKDGSLKCIYFSRGEISLFSTGSSEALRIGEILIRRKKLQPAELNIALEEQKQTSELLGKILLRKQLIDKEDIREALEIKIREEIYDLFLLNEAEFEFHINHLPEDLFDSLQRNTRIAINTSGVIMEGLRRVDEWRLIQRRIKTFDEILVRVDPAARVADDDPQAQLLRLLDGRVAVCELFTMLGGSRFECAKTLYELIECGRIRLITIEEAIAGGRRAIEADDSPRALRFFRMADQLDSQRPEVLGPMADCLVKLQRDEEANQIRRREVWLYHKREMHKEVLALAEPLINGPGKVEIELTEVAFQAALKLKQAEAARKVGNRYLSLAMDAGKLDKAQEVLESLCELDKKDRNLRIELAEVCTKAGNKERAVAILEALAQDLTKEKKVKELIKVLLLIFDIEPKRQDVKQRIQKLLTLQERREKQKKRRVTASGGALIVGLLMLIPPVYYEVKARELYSHAERVEQICLLSNEFSKAKAAYEEVMNSHSFSTQARRAREGLERVTGFERKKQAAINSQKAAQTKMQDEKLEALRKALPDLLKQAKKLEEAGEIRKAFDIYTRIANEYSQVPGARNIPFPVLISTAPKGATVEVNGVAQGVTPLVLRAQKGNNLSLSLTRSGCEPVLEKVQTGKEWRLHYDLKRRPIDELKISGPLQQPLVVQGDRIFFPSRDGFLYAIGQGRKEMTWQRRVGRFGDLISDLASGPEDLIVGNVNGEVTSLAPDSGKAKWRSRLGSAVLAPPVISGDGRWVAAASIQGEVMIIDRATGESKGQFMAEDEIHGAPAFLGEWLLVGSADRRLYRLSVPQASLLHAVEMPAPIITGLTVHGSGVIFATSGGKLYRHEPSPKKKGWSLVLGAEVTGPAVVEGDRAFVGTAGGELVAIGAVKGSVEWRVKISKGRVGRLSLGGGRVFAGAESGEVVAVSQSSGAKDWSYQADAAITGPPLLAFGRLYVPSTTGRILVMEIVE